MGDPPRRLFPDNAELMLKMHRVEPGGTLFVTHVEHDAFTLKPAGAHPHDDQPFEGNLELRRAPAGTEPDTSDGRKLMWRGLNVAYETEWRPLDETLAALVVR